METVQRLSDIQARPVPRASTGFDELDWIYGYSQFIDKIAWGMPKSKISLWSGESGIGKSRLCIDVAKNISMVSPNFKILYFQTESTVEDFAGWAKDTANFTNIYCSGENRISKIIDIIYHVSPHVVFIDSVNQLNEFRIGNKREADRLIEGKLDDNDNVIEPGLKQVCNDVGCHMILLAQVNQDGKSTKGGTALPHLVDIALVLNKWQKDSDSCFTVKVGVKHRYGKKGPNGIFYHEDVGIMSGSQNRLGDKMWCESHGFAVTTLKERICAEIKREEANTELVNFGERHKSSSFFGKIIKACI